MTKFCNIMQKPARSKGAEHTYFVCVSAFSLYFKIYADLLRKLLFDASGKQAETAQMSRRKFDFQMTADFSAVQFGAADDVPIPAKGL